MISTDSLLPGELPRISEPAAPLLPIEGPIVAAALAVKEAGTQLALLSWLVSNAPRDDVMMSSTFATAQQHLTEAWGHYSAYREILSCKGQA